MCGGFAVPKTRNQFYRQAIGALFVATTLVGGCASASITITRTQADLQESVAKRFPVTTEKRLVTVTFRDPKVLLQDGDDRIGLDVETEIRFPFGAPVTGRVASLGRLSYDPSAKAFYFREPIVERLEFPGIEGDRNAIARAALEAVAKPTLESIPVYTLEGRTLKETTAAYLLTEVFVREGKLHLKLGQPRR
jgi:Protein of unknown function (DUF1439)